MVEEGGYDRDFGKQFDGGVVSLLFQSGFLFLGVTQPTDTVAWGAGSITMRWLD